MKEIRTFPPESYQGKKCSTFQMAENILGNPEIIQK